MDKLFIEVLAEMLIKNPSAIRNDSDDSYGYEELDVVNYYLDHLNSTEETKSKNRETS